MNSLPTPVLLRKALAAQQLPSNATPMEQREMLAAMKAEVDCRDRQKTQTGWQGWLCIFCIPIYKLAGLIELFFSLEDHPN